MDQPNTEANVSVPMSGDIVRWKQGVMNEGPIGVKLSKDECVMRYVQATCGMTGLAPVMLSATCICFLVISTILNLTPMGVMNEGPY